MALRSASSARARRSGWDDMSLFPGNRTGGRLTISLLLATTLLVSVPAGAQSIVRSADGRVSLVADAVPLALLLDRFAQLIDLKPSVQPGLGDRLVTVKLDSLPIPAALEQVLLAADVDYVLAGGGDGPVRIAVRDSQPPKELLTRESAQKPTEDPTPVGEQPSTRPTDLAAAERLVELLAPAPRRKPVPGESVVLPFPGTDGNPETVVYSPPPPGTARLPFPGPDGEPLTVVRPPEMPARQGVPSKEQRQDPKPVGRDSYRPPGGG
jgi:hypothetical protein